MKVNNLANVSQKEIAQSAGVVEYTDCVTSAER